MDHDEIQAEDDRLITIDVARAIDERELLAYYQPIINIETRETDSAEALVRWSMGRNKIIPAALFVPSLERTEAIRGLDWFMAEEVCTLLESMDDPAARLPISLNFSSQHATDPDFARKLVDTLAWHGIDPALIRIELNAADLLAGDNALRTLATQSIARGFSVVADRFSADYTDLRVLADLKVSMVKLARDYWHKIGRGTLIVLIRSAAALGLDLAIEGVESNAEMRSLRAAGIRYAQGHLFAEPMSGEDLKTAAGG